MTDNQVDDDQRDGRVEPPRQRLSRMVTVSAVVTAIATSVVALLLLYGAYVIGTIASGFEEFTSGLDEALEPPPEEPLDEGLDDDFQLEGEEPFEQEYPEEEGLTREELEAELDELEKTFGPGPDPSAIRRTADIESEVNDDDLRRHGLGVCFGAVFTAHQLEELGLTEEEAERMIATAEGWCSAELP